MKLIIFIKFLVLSITLGQNIINSSPLISLYSFAEYLPIYSYNTEYTTTSIINVRGVFKAVTLMYLYIRILHVTMYGYDV